MDYGISGGSNWLPPVQGHGGQWNNQEYQRRAPTIVGGDRIFALDGTYVDSAAAGVVKYSAASDAMWVDTENGWSTLKKSIVQFPFQASTSGLYLYMEGALNGSHLNSPNVQSIALCTVKLRLTPITNFGGRTLQDLTWNNFGDMTLDAVGSEITFLATADTLIGTGIGRNRLSNIQPGLLYYGAAAVEALGFVIEINIGKTNVGDTVSASMITSGGVYLPGNTCKANLIYTA